MKIGIFGDSYAKTHDNYPGTALLGPAWWELLSNEHIVTNYGLAGSAAYYSIEKFNQYHHLHDKVIFFMTFPGRIYLGEKNKIISKLYPESINSNFNTYDSTASALKVLQSLDSYEKIDEIRIKAIMDYFLYVCNYDEEDFKIARYTEYVKNVRPDCLVLDVEKFKEASYLEYVHWNTTDESLLKDLVEIRKCHFSDENNVVLYTMFKEWVETGTFNLDLNKFVKPKDSWQRYFTSDLFFKK